jgi:hypothetical protein
MIYMFMKILFFKFKMLENTLFSEKCKKFGHFFKRQYLEISQIAPKGVGVRQKVLLDT